MGDNSVKTRAGAANTDGVDYENALVSKAAFSLSIDPDVQDFKLSSNDVSSFEFFDDVVMEIEKSGNEFHNYAVQLKHTGRNWIKSGLVDPKGKVSIVKYFKDFLKMPEDKQNSFKWIIFTTSGLGPGDVDMSLVNDKKYKMNLAECQSDPVFENIVGQNPKKGHCYKFTANDSEMDCELENFLNNHFPKLKKSSMCQDFKSFLNNLFLYTAQPNVKQMQQDISAKFKTTFSCDDLEVSAFTKIVSTWSTQAKKEKLNKAISKQLIAMSVLSPHIRTLSKSLRDQDLTFKEELLRQAISLFKITFTKPENCGKMLDIWGKSQTLSFDQVNEIGKKFQVISKYVRTNEDLSDEEYTKVLWLSKKCPLIVNWSKSLSSAIDLLDSQTVLILSNEETGCFKNATTFRNLADLKSYNIYEQILDNFSCSLQGKDKINLRRLIETTQNDEIVMVDELVDMVIDDFIAIGGKEDLPDSHIERSLTSHVIDYDFLKHVDQSMALVVSGFKENNKHFQSFEILQINNCLEAGIMEMKDTGKQGRF